MPELVIDQRRRDLGGFEVGRILPAVQRRMVGPFVFFDHMGPVDFPRWHPAHGRRAPASAHRPGHRHLPLRRRDHAPRQPRLAAGDPPRRGQLDDRRARHHPLGALRACPPARAASCTASRHGWRCLLNRKKTAPAFYHHDAADLPTYETDGLWARLIAGEAFGARAKVRTHSPMFYVHWRLGPGAKAQLPAEYSERAAYIAAGSVEVDNQRFGPGKMLVFAPGKPVLFTGVEPAIVMLLGGEPVGERIVEWNFVSSSQAAHRPGESGLARRAHEASGFRQSGIHAAAARPLGRGARRPRHERRVAVRRAQPHRRAFLRDCWVR